MAIPDVRANKEASYLRAASKSGAPALPKRTCSNHPERVAIGVCVITGKAICAECSTRYEGVNYSREGLRILRERRAASGVRDGGRSGAWKVAAVLSAPVFLYLLYLSYLLCLKYLITIREALY